MEDPEAFARGLGEVLDSGDVACFQLRLKDADDDTVRHVARLLAPLVQERGVAFLVNDRPDIAHEVGCDGVHLGQGDAPLTQARSLLGRDAVIGVTCHDSRHLAIEAAEQGADYVAFGAFYPTETKIPHSKAKPKILRWWSETTTVPCVAIGGITVDNCSLLVRAGADFLAVSAGIWTYTEGPAAAVKLFNQRIATAINDDYDDDYDDDDDNDDDYDDDDDEGNADLLNDD